MIHECNRIPWWRKITILVCQSHARGFVDALRGVLSDDNRAANRRARTCFRTSSSNSAPCLIRLTFSEVNFYTHLEEKM